MAGNDKAAAKKLFVSTNNATRLFCFFIGALLSLPVGGLEHQLIHFNAPAWTAPIYWELFIAAFFGTPIWCVIYRRKYKGLATGAIVTFFSGLFLGLLFPGLNFPR